MKMCGEEKNNVSRSYLMNYLSVLKISVLRPSSGCELLNETKKMRKFQLIAFGFKFV